MFILLASAYCSITVSSSRSYLKFLGCRFAKEVRMLALGESCFLHLNCQPPFQGEEPSFRDRLCLLIAKWTFPTMLCTVYAHLLAPLNAYVRHVDLWSERNEWRLPPLT